MIRTVVCVEILCTACGDGWPDDAPPHYDTPEAAYAAVTFEHGWTVATPDAVCPACTALAACRLSGGHDWPPGVEFCAVCGHPDYRDRPDPNTDRIVVALRVLTAADRHATAGGGRW
ncbi:hypothetical protein V6U90_33385 [Micromonospora sp. CPCC 206060]|uniref:hypothetical protein n=1 Tax=Micromonospora sp. CPCC 206060 TaxID=3122406 RepID=UPI002FEFBFDD